MTKKVIYTTKYNTTTKIKNEIQKQYPHKCIICNNTKQLLVTPILPEEIYTELETEPWNNIILCKNCNNKLREYNQKDKNGIKNLIQLLKEQ